MKKTFYLITETHARNGEVWYRHVPCVICESEEDAATYLANLLATCKRCYSDVEVLDQLSDRLFIRYRGEASKECYDSYWVKPVEMWTAESID